MRITVKRDSIRFHLNHARERAIKADHMLFRQTIDEINIDRRKSVGTSRINGGSGFCFALDAIHRALHCFIKILHPHAHAIKAQSGESFNFVRIHRARVNLD